MGSWLLAVGLDQYRVSRKVLRHPETSVFRYSVNVQSRYFLYVRHTEGMPLGGFMPRVSLRVRSRGNVTFPSVRSFYAFGTGREWCR